MRNCIGIDVAKPFFDLNVKKQKLISLFIK